MKNQKYTVKLKGYGNGSREVRMSISKLCSPCGVEERWEYHGSYRRCLAHMAMMNKIRGWDFSTEHPGI